MRKSHKMDNQAKAVPKWFAKLDHEQFKLDVEAVKAIDPATGPSKKAKKVRQDDLLHLQKVELIGHVAFISGLILAAWHLSWITRVSSWLLIGLTFHLRWTIVGHHVGHGGYNEQSNAAYHRGKFAIGFFRRLLDWLDWMLPEAWNVEHNKLHHYHLNEPNMDPDFVLNNTDRLRRLPVPVFVKYVLIAILACTWKWSYYAPNVVAALQRKKGEPNPGPQTIIEPSSWSPTLVSAMGLHVFVYFFLIPYVASLFGASFGYMLSNMVMGDVVANLWGFIVIVPNHAGKDVYYFDTPVQYNSSEFYVRQIVGSSNFSTGGFWNDLLHGYLNYQIEHHVWPNLSARGYTRVQPLLKKVCEKHGVPYVQGNVFGRLYRLLEIMTGTCGMINFNA